MRVLVDYRPALRARTGIGEYVHELARALTSGAAPGLELTVFSASWRDRLDPEAVAGLAGARLIDRHIPVAALNWGWQGHAWPPVEWLAGPQDVVHSATPALLPARRAARILTVFDLHFLDSPAQATDPAQRHFAAHVRADAGHADHVIAGSHYAARLVSTRLGVRPARVTTTPLGAPGWAAGVRATRGTATGRTLLFMGTLETRKNLGLVLDAYEHLLARRCEVPPLVIAGRVGQGGREWLERAGRAPLLPHVACRGYVSHAERLALYTEARALVLPSLDEGFGLPAVEAMACGVPVIATPVGALPEVLGEAGHFVPLGDVAGWAEAIAACADDSRLAAMTARGLTQAARFTWEATASATLDAYRAAIAARAERA